MDTSAVLITLAIGAILLLAWTIGGVLLRSLGTALIVGSIATVTFDLATTANGFGLAVVGFGLWLLGQLHYRLRHREFKSTLLAKIATLTQTNNRPPLRLRTMYRGKGPTRHPAGRIVNRLTATTTSH